MSIGFVEHERKPFPQDRYIATVAISASIIAAVRLARVPDLDMRDVISTVQQSVRLARTILDEAIRLRT